MKKEIKIFFSLMIMVVAICIFNLATTNAASLYPSKLSEYTYEDYVIDEYYIEIDVNENNTFDVTEKITTYFNTRKHGIFRKLPLSNTVKRLDGTTNKNNVKITDVKVLGDNFDTYKESGNFVIKIGSASRTLIGKKEYIIKYNYNIGKDPSDDFDELYYNIIGNEWDTVIGNITFIINMPKEFDATKLGFSSGKYGRTDNDKIEYEVNGSTITGKYNGILKAGEGITVRLEMEEGYFTGYESTVGYFIYFMFGLPILFTIISVLLWKKYGDDEPIVETVEFYPPAGYNSLEVGFLYKGAAGKKDVVSMMVYLANKGYIKLEEIVDEGLLFKTKSFKIVKLKEYDGNNTNEKLFLKGLFRYGKNEVRLKDLTNKFYKTMDKILSNINSSKNEQKIYEKSSLDKKIIIVLMIIITSLIIIVKPLLDYGEGKIFEALCYIIIGIFGFVLTVFGDIKTKIVGVFWVIMYAIYPFIIMVFPCILAEKIYLYSFIVGIICVAIMIIMYIIMSKRNKYGAELFGKILGFKRFLETVEKEKLEMLVMDNPTYFYDILPYTYVLGISDKWISKFEEITINSPDWYSGRSNFSVRSFGNFMNSTMSSARAAMTSSPSSSSGGGGGSSFSGGSSGGFSGGGSGGGGGGSW